MIFYSYISKRMGKLRGEKGSSKVHIKYLSLRNTVKTSIGKAGRKRRILNELYPFFPVKVVEEETIYLVYSKTSLLVLFIFSFNG